MRLRINVLLISTALVFSLLPAAPAWAACGDNSVTRTYNGTGANAPSGFHMGAEHPKQGVGCFDGNVRHASNTMNHRGQWKSNAGNWEWSEVGAKWISQGTQSPVVVLIKGPISVGRPLRIGATIHESWGRWWF